MKISGHPITATEEEYIELAKSALSNGDFDKIFLATDSEGTLRKFKEAFGDRLLYHKNISRTPENEDSLVIFDKDKDPYTLGVEILLDAMTLTHCSGLIAGISYVSYAVRIIKQSRNEQFTYLNLVNKGLNERKGMDYKKAAVKQQKDKNSQK